MGNYWSLGACQLLSHNWEKKEYSFHFSDEKIEGL